MVDKNLFKAKQTGRKRYVADEISNSILSSADNWNADKIKNPLKWGDFFNL